MNQLIINDQTNQKLSKPTTHKRNNQHSQFLISYSQLLNRHFSQSTMQKNQLRKTTLSHKKLKPKTSSANQHKHRKTNSLFNSQKINHLITSSDKSQFKTYQINPQKQLIQSEIKSSSIENFTKSSFTNSKLKLNPKVNQKINQILASNTQQFQKNTLQNVLLNKKLHQTTNQKNYLSNLINDLKYQILKEKKNKAKISTKMAKLMNKIQQTNNIKMKVESERKLINQQTQTLNKDLMILKQKNVQLQKISDNNQQKIMIEKQLIKQLERKNQITKASLHQNKTHLNELKSIYMQETKHLGNVKINFEQVLSEREKFFHVVQKSSANNNF